MTTDPIRKKLTDDPGATPDSSGTMPPLRITALASAWHFSAGPNDSYQITWTTSQPASSLVRFGVVPDFSQISPETDTSPLVTSHTVFILIPRGSVVQYEARSRLGGGHDGAGRSVMDGYVFSAFGGTFTAI